MSTEATRHQNAGVTDEDVENSISGPHVGYDAYGRRDHTYYRCEECGCEALRVIDLLHYAGCPVA